MSLQQAAQHLAAKGRGNDTQLVHMSMKELKSLQDLAQAHGTSLSVNPNTGLPEALRLDSILPTLIGAGVSIATGGAATPLMMGLGVGGVQALRTGSLSKGIMAGLGAYGGAGLAGGLMGAGADAMANAAVAPVAAGAGVDATQAYANEFMAARQAAMDNSPFSALSQGAKGLFNEPGRAGFMTNVGGKRGLTQFGLSALAGPMMAPPKTTTQMPMPDGRTINYSYDPRRMQGLQQAGERNFFEPVYTRRMASGGLAGGMNDDASYPMANVNRNAYGYSTQQTPMMGAQDAGIDMFTGEQRMADGGVTDDVAYPAVVVYGPDGKMYSSPQEAIEAGVTNYTTSPPANPVKAPVDHYAPGSRLASVSGTDTIDYVYDPKTFKFERVNRPASPAPEGGATPGVDAGGGGDMGAGMSDSAFADANFGDAAIAAADAYAAADAVGESGFGTMGSFGSSDFGSANFGDAASAAAAGYAAADAQAGDAAFGGASFGDAAAGDASGGYGGFGAGASGDSGGDSGGWGGGVSGGEAGGDAGGGGFGAGASGDSGGDSGGWAGGGITAFARGGYNLGDYSDGGRLLRGPGDGVSDSIPATIANKRPARLADGEFVVPARIVSELGNGSTEAGARKLYAMMDRIQRARRKTVGKGKVAKNSRADRYLPA
jgi:hypothetical protein